MYVCICNAVTEKQVREAACAGARSLHDLQCDLGVATCCGQCAPHAESLLTRAPGAEARALPAPDGATG